MIAVVSSDRSPTDRDLAGRALVLAELHDQPLSMSTPLTPEQHAAIATYLFETADTSEVLRDLAKRVERQEPPPAPAPVVEPAPGLPPLPPPGKLWFGLTWPDVTLFAFVGAMLAVLIVVLALDQAG